MAYKILRNRAGYDMVVTLIVRKGSNPENTLNRVKVKLAKGQTKKVRYGSNSSPFLNGVAIRAELNGSRSLKRQVVTVRGSRWDDNLNTNNTLTFKTVKKINVRGSNS